MAKGKDKAPSPRANGGAKDSAAKQRGIDEIPGAARHRMARLAIVGSIKACQHCGLEAG